MSEYGRTLDRKQLFYASVVLAILGPCVSLLLFVLGQTTFAILSLYATAPLVFAPGITAVAIQERTWTQPSIDGRILLVIYLVAISIASVTARRDPRPMYFFGALTVASTVSILYYLYRERTVPALLMTGLVIVLFHASTTLTNAMWIGSGDGAIIWVGVENIVRANRSLPTGGYDNHPMFFIGGATLSFLGLPSEVATFLFGTCFALAGFLFTFLLGRWSTLLPRRVEALPALLLPYLHKFSLISTYSVASTSFALYAILPIAFVVADLTGTRQWTNRDKLLLLFPILFLLLLHRIAQVWLIATSVLVYSGVVLTKRYNGEMSFGEHRPRVFGLIVSSFLVAWVFLFAVGGIAAVIFELLVNLTTTPTGEGPDALMRPYGLLTTFVGSSVILMFCIAAIASVAYRRTSVGILFAFLGITFGAVYFPGPAYFINFEMFRISRYGIPFIAVIAGFGLWRLWNGDGTAVRVVLILLLLTGGMFTYASDMYSRDNPIAHSGTFTNYLDEDDRNAMEFSFRHQRGGVAYERTQGQYHRGRVQAEGWGEVRSRSVHPSTQSELCNVSVHSDQSELATRGQVIYGGIAITDERELQLQGRNRLYDNGNNVLYSPC